MGTPACTMRGFGEEDFREVAEIIAETLIKGEAADIDALRGRVEALARKYPLYPDLEDWKML